MKEANYFVLLRTENFLHPIMSFNGHMIDPNNFSSFTLQINEAKFVNRITPIGFFLENENTL
jgi:hypothetical protein